MTMLFTMARWWWPLVTLLLSLGGSAGGLAGQSSVRMWGGQFCDTRALELPCKKLAAYHHVTAYLREDGQIFQQGQAAGFPYYLAGIVPPPPPGLTYVDLGIGWGYGLGMLSDGTIAGWGTAPWPPYQIGVVDIPALPVGLRYTRMAVGGVHALLQRSDGVLMGWCATGSSNHGQGKIPPIPLGVAVREMQAKSGNSAFLLSNGTLLVWGDNADGQCNVPTLPSGVAYVGMSIGGRHTLALRSDGMIEAFGFNYYGQCNVPPLLPGTVYRSCAAGAFHSVALRSDGVLIAWGDNQFEQCAVPTVPAGLVCKQLVAGNYHTAARLSDGSVVTWGYHGAFEGGLPVLPGLPAGPPLAQYVDASVSFGMGLFTLSDGTVQRAFGLNNYGQAVPPLPAGTHYVAAKIRGTHSVALRSDGQLVAWGDNSRGQCNVPVLPPGKTYTKLALGQELTMALRSDGEAVAFGDNTYGQCDIPPLPAGLVYLDIHAYYSLTVLLRSDGVVVVPAGSGLVQPSLPPGIKYVSVAVGGQLYPMFATLRSDGEVDVWGPAVGGAFWVPPQSLPSGVYYVEADVGQVCAVLRRSDGEVVVCGVVAPPYDFLARVPPLEPGTSYVQVSTNKQSSNIGRVGPTSTYVGIRPGCAGSRPATRLVPRDTPRIGHNLQVTLFDLPVGMAALAMSFQQLPSPVSLGFLGMPGCDWSVPLDAVVLLSGSSQQAQFVLPIPDVRSLIGTHFFHQALVLDPGAGNGFGAVVSDAAEGVIGDW